MGLRRATGTASKDEVRLALRTSSVDVNVHCDEIISRRFPLVRLALTERSGPRSRARILLALRAISQNY